MSKVLIEVLVIILIAGSYTADCQWLVGISATA